MSFIRSTSNPEGLYVWEDVSGHVTFSIQGKTFHIDKDLFYDFFRKYFSKNDVRILPYCEGATTRLSIEKPLYLADSKQYMTVCECLYSPSDRKRISRRMDGIRINKYLKQYKTNKKATLRHSDIMVEVNLNGKRLYLHMVTWKYLADNVMSGLREESWYTRFIDRVIRLYRELNYVLNSPEILLSKIGKEVS